MTVIRKEIEFTVLDTVDPKEQTVEYFIKSGFKYIDNYFDRKLNFSRGSIASNMWTFNPLKWKSEIDIEINEQEVKASFNVNATGQIPTFKEENLWDSFIENYQRYLNDKSFDFKTENERALNRTKANSLKYVGWAALGGLIGRVPAGFIAYWTGLNSIISIGAVSGVIILLTMRINDDKKKKGL